MLPIHLQCSTKSACTLISLLNFNLSLSDMKENMEKLSVSTDRLTRTIDSLQVAVRKQQLEMENDKPAGAYIAMFPAGGNRTLIIV